MYVTVEVQCPTCGEATTVGVDAEDGETEVESDCQVCCRPLHVTVVCRRGRVLRASADAGW